MKAIYIAEDGEQFSTKEECIKYENSLPKIGKSIFLDDRGNIISICNQDDICEYVYVDSKQSYDIIEEYNNKYFYWCTTIIDNNYDANKGYYFYDDDNDEWKQIEYEYEKILRIAQVFAKVRGMSVEDIMAEVRKNIDEKPEL